VCAPLARSSNSATRTRYDADDVAHALTATMDLFRWVARETAERLGVSYAEAADTHATSLLACYLHKREGPP
jgi:hypothetical protein